MKVLMGIGSVVALLLVACGGTTSGDADAGPAGLEPDATPEADGPAPETTAGGDAGEDAAADLPDGAGPKPDVPPPPPCPEVSDEGPPPTGAVDSCDQPASGVVALAPPVGASRLVITPRGSGEAGVAAAGDDTVHAWGVSGSTVEDTSWPAPGLRSGPWIVAMDDGGYAVVWGDDQGVRFARLSGGEPRTVLSGDVWPEGFLARPGGTRILVRDGVSLELVTTDDAGEIVGQHYVNAAENVDAVWTLVEDELVVMPFTKPSPAQDLWFQTSSLEGGQCSAPAPYGVSPGIGGAVLATGLSYGTTVFAWRTAGDSDCPATRRLHARTQLETLFDVASPIPLGDRVDVVPAGQLAAVLTAAPGEAGGGWRLLAAFLDLDDGALGGTADTAVGSAGAPPTAWDAARARGVYLVAWEAPDSGVRLRSVCF